MYMNAHTGAGVSANIFGVDVSVTKTVGKLFVCAHAY